MCAKAKTAKQLGGDVTGKAVSGALGAMGRDAVSGRLRRKEVRGDRDGALGARGITGDDNGATGDGIDDEILTPPSPLARSAGDAARSACGIVSIWAEVPVRGYLVAAKVMTGSLPGAKERLSNPGTKCTGGSISR